MGAWKDERWKMKDEKWKMKDERWKMKNEKWKMKNENERWKMKNEKWKNERGECSRYINTGLKKLRRFETRLYDKSIKS